MQLTSYQTLQLLTGVLQALVSQGGDTVSGWWPVAGGGTGLLAHCWPLWQPWPPQHGAGSRARAWT